MKLSQIIKELEARGVEVKLFPETESSNDIEIEQVAPLDEAGPQHITFFNNPKLKSQLGNTNAGAVLLREPEEGLSSVQLLVQDPYYAYAIVAQLLNPLPAIKPGIHPKAEVNGGAMVDPSSQISAFVTIEKGAQIAAHCVIGEGAFIGRNVQIGEGCRIGPNVVIHHDCILGDQVIIKAGAVIGGDGFGWAPHQGRWEKIPQLGRVVIGNRVSIGNNVTIDRGALKDTQIGDDCIIDNLVHLAHNVQLGAGTAVVAQTGISGSTTIGKQNIIAGQVGFAGHIETADGCQFMAKSGVTHSIKQPGSYSGFPAQPTAEWQKNTVRSRQLDKMAKQLKMLQKQLAELESKL
ncbi:UDP-3-O-(3-hydroxymyristoyl)glucosamine N-acyltransferase [Galenea microaerophila]